jgi:hypothetical protein
MPLARKLLSIRRGDFSVYNFLLLLKEEYPEGGRWLICKNLG